MRNSIPNSNSFEETVTVNNPVDQLEMPINEKKLLITKYNLSIKAQTCTSTINWVITDNNLVEPANKTGNNLVEAVSTWVDIVNNCVEVTNYWQEALKNSVETVVAATN